MANPVRSSDNRHWGSSIASNNRYLVIGARDFTFNVKKYGGYKRQGVVYVYDISNTTMSASDIPNNLIQVGHFLDLDVS